MRDEDERTLYCGNLSNKCTESLLYELFVQGGPLEKVHIPKDRDGTQKTFGFITYKHSVSVPYAIELFDGTTLFNRALILKTRQSSDLPQPQMSQQHIPMPINFPNINPMGQFGNSMFMNPPMPGYGMNMIPMFLPPGMTQYPSQVNSSSLIKEDRRNTRNHPYNRERDRDRERNDRDRERNDRSDRSHERCNRDRERNDRNRERNNRDRYSDYDQPHRREHRNQHRGSNGYSRNNRHYR